MRRENQLSSMLFSRRTKETPKKLLRKLRMKRIFQFINKEYATMIFSSYQVEDGKQIEILNRTIRFVVEG